MSPQRNSGLFHRFTSKFSMNDSDGVIRGEIPLEKEFGSCILCGINPPDSKDHFPLVSMGNNGIWYYRNFHNFRLDVPEDKIGICQNGIAYKTICRKCNSELGTKYDPYLLDLFLQFKRAKSLARITYSFNNILRGLAGHFLAASLTDEPDNPRNLEMLEMYQSGRNFGYKIYVAPYSGSHTAVLREVSIYNFASTSFSFLYVMKIAPMSIILTKDSPRDIRYSELLTDRDKIRIDFDKCAHPFYPELTEISTDPPLAQIIGQCVSQSIISVRKLWQPVSNKSQNQIPFSSIINGIV